MTESVIRPAATATARQPWLSSPAFDLPLILGPAFFTSAIVLAFRSRFEGASELPIWLWVCLVLSVDVAHVYSTLFRTYLDSAAMEKNRALLLSVPAFCFVGGSLLYAIDALLFWKALAYLAVFHFVRQQYGFMALYGRADPLPFARFRLLDSAAIYLAALYPLVYWHTHLPRNFNWFIEGDFVEGAPAQAASLVLIAYVAVGALYAVKEAMLFRLTGFFNLPRNLLLAGTALAWWTGIVAVDSDTAFTLTNVVSHGVPYMALIWLYQHRRAPGCLEAGPRPLARLARACLTMVPAFLAFLWILAYIEEGLWDGFIWREHLGIFPAFASLPHLSDPAVLALIVPLLSLPQSTHYVLDGFIWRVKGRTSAFSA